MRLLAVRHARVIQAPGNDARSLDARDRLLRTVERTQDCLLDQLAAASGRCYTILEISAYGHPHQLFRVDNPQRGAHKAAARRRPRCSLDHLVQANQRPSPWMPSVKNGDLVVGRRNVGLVATGSTTRYGCTPLSATGRPWPTKQLWRTSPQNRNNQVPHHSTKTGQLHPVSNPPRPSFPAAPIVPGQLRLATSSE
jgi:hypothetical protein